LGGSLDADRQEGGAPAGCRDSLQARTVAEQIAKNAFHNVAYFVGTYDTLKTVIRYGVTTFEHRGGGPQIVRVSRLCHFSINSSAVKRIIAA